MKFVLIIFVIHSGRYHPWCLWIFGGQKSPKKKIFIWQKRARHELSCDVFHLFIALFVIGIFFDLYLSVCGDIIETHTLTNDVK